MFAFLRRHVVWVVVLVLGLAVAGGVVFNGQAKAQKAQAAKVAAAKAPKSPFVAIANGKADVEGGMIQVAARRAGIVREVLVSEGDRVTRGQV
ncbi:MAG: hemolysin secretion protein D, partial [Phenylobacterium sp.]